MKKRVGKELAGRGLGAKRDDRESEVKNGFAVLPAADDAIITVELIDKLLEEDV